MYSTVGCLLRINVLRISSSAFLASRFQGINRLTDIANTHSNFNGVLRNSRFHATASFFSRLNFSTALIEQKKLEQRTVILDNVEASGQNFTIELMNQYDTDLASRFGFMHMNIAQPLALSLKCSHDDLEIIYYDQCKRAIYSGTSVIAFDNQKQPQPRCYPEMPDAMVLISTKEISKESLPSPKEYRIKEDFGSVVEADAYLRRNANRVNVLLNELQSQFPYFLPPDVKKIGTLESICIDSDSFKNGLLDRMLEESIKLAKASGVEYLSWMCLTEQMRTLCSKMNFKPYMDFPLTMFKDRGNVVFKPIQNDSTSSNITLHIAKL